MLYLSIAFFVVACLAAMFGYSVPADPEAAYVAQIVAVAALGTSIIVFMVDRLWGAYSLRRQFTALDPSRSQSQRARSPAMVQSHHARAR